MWGSKYQWRRRWRWHNRSEVKGRNSVAAQGCVVGVLHRDAQPRGEWVWKSNLNAAIQAIFPEKGTFTFSQRLLLLPSYGLWVHLPGGIAFLICTRCCEGWEALSTNTGYAGYRDTYHLRGKHLFWLGTLDSKELNAIYSFVYSLVGAFIHPTIITVSTTMGQALCWGLGIKWTGHSFCFLE